MVRSKIRWLRALALLPIGCMHNEVPPVATTTSPTNEAPASASASESAPVADGCFCHRHKSDAQFAHGRPACTIGQLDFAGTVCKAGDPAEGPLPPPDLPTQSVFVPTV